MNSEVISIKNLVNENKKKKKAIFNILNFNGSYMGSVKVTNNLLQKRK